jgi:hypothetical protein
MGEMEGYTKKGRKIIKMLIYGLLVGIKVRWNKLDWSDIKSETINLKIDSEEEIHISEGLSKCILLIIIVYMLNYRTKSNWIGWRFLNLRTQIYQKVLSRFIKRKIGIEGVSLELSKRQMSESYKMEKDIEKGILEGEIRKMVNKIRMIGVVNDSKIKTYKDVEFKEIVYKLIWVLWILSIMC